MRNTKQLVKLYKEMSGHAKAAVLAQQGRVARTPPTTVVSYTAVKSWRDEMNDKIIKEGDFQSALDIAIGIRNKISTARSLDSSVGTIFSPSLAESYAAEALCLHLLGEGDPTRHYNKALSLYLPSNYKNVLQKLLDQIKNAGTATEIEEPEDTAKKKKRWQFWK